MAFLLNVRFVIVWGFSRLHGVSSRREKWHKMHFIRIIIILCLLLLLLVLCSSLMSRILYVLRWEKLMKQNMLNTYLCPGAFSGRYQLCAPDQMPIFFLVQPADCEDGHSVCLPSWSLRFTLVKYYYFLE